MEFAAILSNPLTFELPNPCRGIGYNLEQFVICLAFEIMVGSNALHLHATTSATALHEPQLHQSPKFREFVRISFDPPHDRARSVGVALDVCRLLALNSQHARLARLE